MLRPCIGLSIASRRGESFVSATLYGELGTSTICRNRESQYAFGGGSGSSLL